MNHTPGPWRANNRLEKGFLITTGGGELGIARTIRRSLNDNNLKVQKANAQLIAAAPELLEAVKASERWMRKLVEDNGFQPNDSLAKVLDEFSRNTLQQAIAKAEGRS